MTIYEQIINTLEGLLQDEFTTGEIQKLVSEKHGSNLGSILPYDYCYNRMNKGIDFNQHLFIWLKRGKYRYVGENYPYDGVVFHRPKGQTEDSIAGEWNNGKFEPAN